MQTSKDCYLLKSHQTPFTQDETTHFHSLPSTKILHWWKLKAFADDKIKCGNKTDDFCPK